MAATHLLSSSSIPVMMNIKKRTADKYIVINPRVAKGSATDSCMGSGCGKAHGPSWMADMVHHTKTTNVDLGLHFPSDTIFSLPSKYVLLLSRH